MDLSRVIRWRGLMLGVALCLVAGQAVTAARPLALVPMPRVVDPRPGTAALGPGWKVACPSGADDERTAALLVREGTDCYGWNWHATRAGSGSRTVELRTIAVPAGAPALFADQGYRLEIGRDRIVIAAPSALGRFYGAQTLRQLMRGSPAGVLPCVRIEDSPALEWRGISDDISRGQISTLEDFKGIIRQLAYYKINLYQLYIEDMFRFEGARTSGETRGALTKSELEVLVAEGLANHVVVSPIFETLAHQERLLSLTEHQRFAAGDTQRRGDGLPQRAWGLLADVWQGIVARFVPTARDESAEATAFSASDPQTLRFVQSLVDEIAVVTRGPFFHIGGDEWKPADKPAGAIRSYGRYLGQVANHVRQRHGCRAMVYGDVMLERPEAGVELPRDVVVVDWQYGPQDSFPSVGTLQRQGFRDVIVSPGLWTWRTFYPNHAWGFQNVAAFAQAGKRAGALGCVTAAWGDGGSENLRVNNWPGYAFAAAASWESVAPDADMFLRRFAVAHHGSDRKELSEAVKLLGWRDFDGLGYVGQLYHRSLTVRPRTSRSVERMRALGADMRRVEELLTAVAAGVRFNPDDLAAARHCARRYRYLSERELLLDAAGRRLQGRTAAQLSAGVRDSLVREFSRLETTATALQADYGPLWLSHNRPEGLAENDDRMAKQGAMLRRLRELARSGALKVDDSFLKMQAPIALADETEGARVP